MKKIIVICTLFSLHSLCMALEPERENEPRSSETHNCVIVNMNSVVHYPKERDGRKFNTYEEYQDYWEEQRPKHITKFLAERFPLLIALKKKENSGVTNDQNFFRIINKIRNNKSDLEGMLGDDLAVELDNLSLDDEEAYRNNPKALDQHVLDVVKLGWLRVNQGLASEEYINNKDANLAKVKRALQSVGIQIPSNFFTLQDDLSFLPRAGDTKAKEAVKGAKNTKADGAVQNLDLVPAISG